MSVPAPRRPRHDARWETIRYALDSNARMLRLCLILLVTSLAPAAAAVVAVLIHHMLLCDARAQICQPGYCCLYFSISPASSSGSPELM